MTYDIAVWKHSGPLSDDAASDEFSRRFEESDERYPNYRQADPELLELADMLEARFPESPWESLRESLDGDFLYLTVAGVDSGWQVETYLVEIAAHLGLLVYSPLSESVATGAGHAHDWESDVESEDPAPHRRLNNRQVPNWFSRSEATKILRMKPQRLRECADRVGADPQRLDFAELLTISLLAIDDLHPADRWPEAAAAIRSWWESGPDPDDMVFLSADDLAAEVEWPGKPPTQRARSGMAGHYDLTGFAEDLVAKASRKS